MGRETRLVETADLDALQRVLVALCGPGDPVSSVSRVLIVPTRHAAEQFRRTLEHRVLHERWVTPVSLSEPLGLPRDTRSLSTALTVPRSVTRDGWYDLLHEGSGDHRPRVSPITREVLMAAAARAAATGTTPAPFLIRPGLVAELVTFYEQLRRLGHDLHAARALLLPDLEAEAGADRGAARLLAQTHFLLAAFTDYEARLAEAGELDEEAIRRACVTDRASLPVEHVVVAVGDHQAEDQGLWPADLALLDRLPLKRLDIVFTRREGGAGLSARFAARWPDAPVVTVDAQRAPTTLLEVPAGGARWFSCRDREEEVLACARRFKMAPRADAAGSALVYRRPLPYLYLTQQVFTASAIPYETSETLPLAAEPWAAALDVLIDSVLAGHTRATLVALLRHAHFQFTDASGTRLAPEAVAAFDRLLARDRYLGSPARLAELVAAWREGRTAGQRTDIPAALAAAAVATPLLASLGPFRTEAPAARHLDLLIDVLAGHARPTDGQDEAGGRARRVRAAVDHVLDTLRTALRAHDNRPTRAREVFAVLRRWIEARTFAPRRDGQGIQVLDTGAARFGIFQRIRLVGLIDGEWPDASARNIFYPAFLLARLGWPDERARAAATRAAFADLLTLPSVAVGVSLPELEQDAVVRPSALLDELEMFGPSRQLAVPQDEARLPVVPEAAMLSPRVTPAALDRLPMARAWFDWRRGRRGASTRAGQTSQVPPIRYSVTAVERYLQCPFQYFAASVLRLTEEPEDEAGLPSRDAGVFVHDVLHACYAAWQARGRVRITADDLPEARVLFQSVAERALDRLPAGDRPFERLRLFGSAVASGLLEKVLRADVEAFGDLVSRELEVEIDGHITLPADDDQRVVAIRGRVDRVDRTADGGIRVIDYKSGRRPQQHGLQPAVYALSLIERDAALGRTSSVAASGYVALREVSPWAPTVKDGDDAAEDARRFGDAVAGIESGAFPVRPASIFRCRFCEFGSVCRKDYLGDE